MGILGQSDVGDEGNGRDGWHDEVVGVASITDGSGELKLILTFDEVGVLKNELLVGTVFWKVKVNSGDGQAVDLDGDEVDEVVDWDVLNFT